ncbi:MAG: replicative DNA helicase [Oscillospiraceae bacterium]|nr:replicative DNA helicase [Oscillospiraceae bacterium]
MNNNGNLPTERDFGVLSLPYSNEAEQAVLGSIIVNPNILNELLEAVRGEYFYNEQHREIFAAILRLFRVGEPIDIVTVINELASVGVFSEESGKRYIIAITNNTPNISNVEAYAKIIKQKYEMRSLILASYDIIKDASDESNDPRAVIDRAEQRIYEISDNRNVQGLKIISEVLMTAFDTLMEISSGNGDEHLGVSTGIKTLDNVIAGLNKSDLILLAARPGMGKTSFALNIARNVAVNSGRKVAFFSLEMTREQLALRMLSSESGVGGFKLREGKLNQEEWHDLINAAKVFNDAPIYLDETGNITVTEMKAKLRRLGNVGLVVIDYLQLMQSGKSVNRVQEVSEITRGLKIMAKELNVPVLCLSQLNRSTEQRHGHKPQLSDLRDSGSIEQDADIVLFLYRDSYYSDDGEGKPEDIDKSKAICSVAKNRHGDTNEIPLHWSGETTRFTALEERYGDN